MLHPSTKKLVDKLLEMTAASKIDWKEGDEASCFYDTEGYRVTIGQSPSRLVLLDAGGRVLETASEILLNGTTDHTGMTYAAKVEQMVAEARRQLTGSVAAIDHIVSALDLSGNGFPDIEEEAPAAESGVTAYPDETEMTSRVAALAHRVNSVPPESEPEADAEPETDALGANPELTDAETVELASEAETEIETEISEHQSEHDNSDDDRDSSEGMATGLAVAGGAAALSGLAAHSGMAEPETSESSEGWTLPETDFEDEFDSVDEPVELEEDSTDVEASFTPAETSEAEAEIEAVADAGAPEDTVETEPEFVSMTDETPVEAELSEPPVLTSGFGAIGPYGADTSHDAPTDEAEAELVMAESTGAPEAGLFDEAEAVVQPATQWGQAQEGIDALEVTPYELTTPEMAEYETEYLASEFEAEEAEPMDSEDPETLESYDDEAEYLTTDVEPETDEAEELPVEAVAESTGFVSQFAGSTPELPTETVEDVAVADEAEHLESESPSEVAEADEATRTEPVDVRLAGTPYVTGFGRVLPAQVQEEAELQVEDVMPGLMSEITDLAEEFTDVAPAASAEASDTGAAEMPADQNGDLAPEFSIEAEETTLETAEHALADVESLNDEMLSMVSEETKTPTPSKADEPAGETFESGTENADTAEADFAEFQETTIQEIAEAAGAELPEVDRMTYESEAGLALPDEQPEARFETDAEPAAIQTEDLSDETHVSGEKAEEDEPDSGFLSSVASGIGAIATQAKDMAESAVEAVTGSETEDPKTADTADQDDDPQVGKKSVFKYNPWM